MSIFNVHNVEVVWRGITLRGFASSKISIQQTGDNGSNAIIIGIAGESFSYPNTQRLWLITSKFHNLSLSYPILVQDNLNNIENTLIVRNLNNGLCEIFTECSISKIASSEDGKEITVTWSAVKHNGR